MTAGTLAGLAALVLERLAAGAAGRLRVPSPEAPRLALGEEHPND